MVEFEELRIDKDNLIIRAVVPNDSCHKDITIKKVLILDSEGYTEDLDPDHTTDEDVKKYIIYETSYSDPNIKDIFLNINENDIIKAGVDFSNKMYVVYVYVDGEYDIKCPCGTDKIFTKGLVFNLCGIYNRFMSYIKTLDNKCQEIPSEFINLYMQYLGIKYSILTYNYTDAIQRYNKIMFKSTNTSTTCGCFNS